MQFKIFTAAALLGASCQISAIKLVGVEEEFANLQDAIALAEVDSDAFAVAKKNYAMDLFVKVFKVMSRDLWFSKNRKGNLFESGKTVVAAFNEMKKTRKQYEKDDELMKKAIYKVNREETFESLKAKNEAAKKKAEADK